MSQEFKVPELGENIETGVITKVLITQGGRVARDQGVVELETGKAVVEVPATEEGQVEEILVKEGETVRVGQALFRVKTESTAESKAEEPKVKQPPKEEKPAATKPATPPVEAKQEQAPSEPLPAGPAVRRLAREMNVDLNGVKGSGPHGRILESDLRRPAPASALALPDFTRFGSIQKEAMSPVRRLTAQHVAQAWATVPHAVQLATADITDMEALRLRHKADVESAGGRLSLTVILLKAVTGALKAYPRFNASVDMEHFEIHRKNYYHIGVAMDTDRGLLVPVIRDVDRKNLLELAVELARLTDRAREGKLSPDELAGGNFTITNAGALGGDIFIPIVNWPEVAILGVARTRDEQGRTLLPLTLSYDHRIIDGADGVRFLRWLTESLEDPLRLALKG